MRRIFLLAISVSVISFPAVSYAGLLEFFFPSLKEEEYDPTKDMIAPFAVGQGAEEKEKLNGLPEDSLSLDKPHRMSKDIGTWVMTAAGAVMNFEAGKAAEQLNSRDYLFDTVGKNQYLTFLRDSRILSVAQDGRFNVVSYVNQPPLLLNEGNVNGRYRWLFQVPVVVTYMDKKMKSYKNAEAKLIQEANLNVQVGRIRSDDKPDGLQIEQWAGDMEALEKTKDSMP